jgi:hypothetical protein
MACSRFSAIHGEGTSFSRQRRRLAGAEGAYLCYSRRCLVAGHTCNRFLHRSGTWVLPSQHQHYSFTVPSTIAPLSQTHNISKHLTSSSTYCLQEKHRFQRLSLAS